MKSGLQVLLVFLLLVAGGLPASAEVPANADDPPSVWMAYCASFLPCKMTMSIQSSGAHAAGASLIDRVKGYFSGLGATPAMTASEFKEYLATLTPAERKKFVGECISHRGASGREVCEKDYLLDSEIRALAYQRAARNTKSKLDQLKDERDRLVREDNRLQSELMQNCNRPELPCSVYSGDSFNREFSSLRWAIDKLNSEPEYKASFGVLESKTVAWMAATQKAADFSLPPRVSPASNPWDSLPSRTGPDGPAVAGADKSAGSSGFKDPYANVSDELSRERINAHAWNIGAITGALTLVGQAAQARSAMESPEAAAAAKEVLGSMGLGEYAASDEAIALGRKAAAETGASSPAGTPGQQVPTFTPALPQQQTAGSVDTTNYSAMNCSAREQAVKNTRIPDNASPSNAQETVMWMTMTAVQMFDDGCPGITAAERQEYANAYKAAESACQAIRSDPSSCRPTKHF